ncbi:MAG: hypothetical protein JO133_00240 [Burkholderiaceae bacterium]|nr:hypothetical protein [Burkholderiaceae bacterium]
MRASSAVDPLLFAAAILLAGCWTAPVANVRPKGEPRLIQAAIAVESIKSPAIVQSVDVHTRTIVVRSPADASATVYKFGTKVSNFDQIKVGDEIEPTVVEELSVYVLENGKLPGKNGGLQTVEPHAKVLTVDSSYRLLTLQYPNGQKETFKVGLEARLAQMEAGDDVVIRTIEAVAVRVRSR